MARQPWLSSPTSFIPTCAVVPAFRSLSYVPSVWHTGSTIQESTEESSYRKGKLLGTFSTLELNFRNQ